jgi:nucleoside-diphosphate-sugar epimerase
VRLRGGPIDVGLTGATGHLGSRLLARLLADPDVTRVRSVARRPLPAHPKLVHTRCDLCDPAASAALAGADVLWHLGFSLWRDRSARAVNLRGTSNVLAGKPGRVVLASSAAVYGARPDNPLPIAEDWPPRPNRECPYAADKLTCERRCLDAGPPALALRIGAVLGPHADPRVRQAVSGYRRAVPGVAGANEALQFLDEDDVARALHLAGKSTAVGVLNVAPDDWLSASDVAHLARSRVVRLPLPLLLAGSELAFGLKLLPFGADRTILLNGPLALDSRRTMAALGWRATHTSAAVLAAALGC